MSTAINTFVNRSERSKGTLEKERVPINVPINVPFVLPGLLCLFRHFPRFCTVLDALIAPYRRFLTLCGYLHVCPLSVPQRAPQNVPEREKRAYAYALYKLRSCPRTNRSNLKSYDQQHISGCYQYSVLDAFARSGGLIIH